MELFSINIPSNQDKMGKFLQMHEEEEEEVAICPSFNSYSCDGVAEVAARVQAELSTSNQQPDDEEDMFEFIKDFDFSSSIMASQIRQAYPVFNRHLLPSEDDDLRRNHNQENDSDTKFRAGHVEGDDVARVRLSLKNLFVDEPDHPSSCSSEADELDKMPTGTSCFCKLKSPAPSKLPGKCKKSNSKWWRFLEPDHPSSCSEADELDKMPTGTSCFCKLKSPAPSKLPGKCKKSNSKWRRFLDLRTMRSSDGKTGSLKEAVAAVKTKEKGETVAVPHVKNKAATGGGTTRSYLPYRLDLLGFFPGNIPMQLRK